MVEKAPSVFDPFEGQVINGNWRLDKKLGEGGMGAVYLAEQLSVNRLVAVKVLRPEWAGNPEFATRFRREARRAAAVTDPHIVTVFDSGESEDGHLFISMEYVRGDTLSSLIKRGPLPIEKAISFGIQLAEALQCVHQAGIIHRDVKPANAMVREGTDHLKLMDFGIARIASDSERTYLTKGGLTPGTPAFMAPEQIREGICSVQTDIYSWGLVLFAMLTGRKPFEALTQEAMQYQQIHEPPPRVRSLRPEVPPEIEAVVLQALEKRPDQRQHSMAEAAAALRAAQWSFAERKAEPPTDEPASKPSRRTLWPVWATLVMLAIGGAFVVAQHLSNWSVGPQGTPEPAVWSSSSSTSVADAEDTVNDALGVAEMFLDRGEYDSAIQELERASKRVPSNDILHAKLDSVRKAKTAEIEVLGYTP